MEKKKRGRKRSKLLDGGVSAKKENTKQEKARTHVESLNLGEKYSKIRLNDGEN